MPKNNLLQQKQIHIIYKLYTLLQTHMSNRKNLSQPPQIQNQYPGSRQGAMIDSLRFSYDFDSNSQLAYSDDGRQIDFDFQEPPEYYRQVDNNINDASGISLTNRKLQIFQKYRTPNQREEPVKSSNIIESFDKIFKIKEQKANINPITFGFKKKENNQQNTYIQATVKINQAKSNKQIFMPTIENQNPANLFILQNQKQQQQLSTNQKINREREAKKYIDIHENLARFEYPNTINTSIQSIGAINSKNSYSNYTSQTIINDFNNFSSVDQNMFQLKQTSNNIKHANVKAQNLQKDLYEKGMSKQILQTGNKYISKPNYLQNNLIEDQIKTNKNSTLNISNQTHLFTQPVKILSPMNKKPTIIINNKNITNPGITKDKSFSQFLPNDKIIKNTLFEQQSRVALFLRKIRKMNSIYPNFNHPAINLIDQASLCNKLAAVFEQAFNFLQKMTNKALERAAQSKYLNGKFTSLNYFLNSQWQKQKYKEWALLDSSLRPRTNFVQNQIDEKKIRSALINYKEVILYYKQRKIDLSNQQGIKNYFRIRQKFWSLQRNIRSISQDVYRLFQQSQYPQFYYEYLKILRAPLPAKNDQHEILHLQKILNNLIINRQKMEPLSCSEIGQAIKIKIQRQLKFLCPL